MKPSQDTGINKRPAPDSTKHRAHQSRSSFPRTSNENRLTVHKDDIRPQTRTGLPAKTGMNIQPPRKPHQEAGCSDVE